MNLATNTETIQSLLSIRKPLMYLIEFIRQRIIETRVSLFLAFLFVINFFLRFQDYQWWRFNPELKNPKFVLTFLPNEYIYDFLYFFQCPLEWFHYVSLIFLISHKMLNLKFIHFSALRWNYICSERKMVLPDMYCQYVTSQEKITSKNIVTPSVWP